MFANDSLGRHPSFVLFEDRNYLFFAIALALHIETSLGSILWENLLANLAPFLGERSVFSKCLLTDLKTPTPACCQREVSSTTWQAFFSWKNPQTIAVGEWQKMISSTMISTDQTSAKSADWITVRGRD